MHCWKCFGKLKEGRKFKTRESLHRKRKKIRNLQKYDDIKNLINVKIAKGFKIQIREILIKAYRYKSQV